jgi:hypothetical protein
VIEPVPYRGMAVGAPPLPLELSDDERELLASWAEHARSAGIEAVENLRERPWPLSADEANILGVFRQGERLAAWLVVGRTGSWAVASCLRGDVMGSAATLAEALELIHHIPSI